MSEYRGVYFKALTDEISHHIIAPLSQPIEMPIPGQYIEIEVEGHWLPCSVANIVSSDQQLHLYVRHTDAVAVSQKLEHTLQHQICNIRGPKGRCMIAKQMLDVPIGFLAGGTGFAPCQALLAHLLDLNPQATCTLFWGVKKSTDLYAHEQLMAYEKKHPHFKFVPVLSGQEPNWKGLTGWVHEKALAALQLQPVEYLFTSGPYPMVQKAFEAWKQLGLDASAFYSDMINS